MEGFKTDFNRDDESKGTLAVLERVRREEGEEHENHATFSEHASPDDGASVLAAELVEAALWEAKVALFLESRPESSQEASDPPSPADMTAAEGVSGDGAFPTFSESASAEAEQPVFATVDDETLPSEVGTTSPTVNTAAAAGSLGTVVKVVGRGENELIADDAVLDAGPETGHEQPFPATEALMEGRVAVAAADLDAVERACASGVMQTSAMAARVHAKRPFDEASKEFGGGDAVRAGAKTIGSKATAQVEEPGDTHPAVGGALVEAGPESDPLKPDSSAEVVAGGDEEVPTAGPDAADAISTSAGSAKVPAEQLTVEALHESDGGHTTPVEAEATPPVVGADPAASLENTKIAELGDVQPTVDDAVVDAGPEAAAEAEQPDQTAGSPLVDYAAVSAEDQAALGKAGTSAPAVSVDPGESSKVAELGPVEPAAGDTLVDADREREDEPEQSAPPAEALGDSDGAAPTAAADPDAAKDGANAAEALLMATESVEADVEQPVVEASNESDSSGRTAPVEAEATPPVVSADPAASLESTETAELGDVQPAAGGTLVDASPEAAAEAEQPVSTADPDAVGEANGSDGMPTSAEAAGADPAQPDVEAANELGGGDTAPAETNTTTPAGTVDTCKSSASAYEAEPGEAYLNQGDAGDAMIDPGQEPQAEAIPTAGAPLESGAAVPAAELDVVGKASTSDVIPTSTEVARVDTEQPATEAAIENTGHETAPVETDTTIGPAASLENTKAADVDEVQPAVDDALVDASPEPDAEPEQPAPPAEALGDGDGAAPTAAADPDAAKDGANAAEALLMATESAGADVEQPVVEASNESVSGRTAPVEAEATPPVVSADPAASLESTETAELGDVQPTAGGTLVEPGPEAAAEAEQPDHTAGALEEDGAAVSAADPDALGEVDTSASAVSVDSGGSSKVAELGDVETATGDRLIDVVSEPDPEQPAPATEALMGGDTAVTAAESGPVGESNGGDTIPPFAESAGVDAEQPAVKVANDLAAGDATLSTNKTDTPMSVESSQVADLGEVQPDAGDAPIERGVETAAEQPVPATERAEVVPTVDCSAIGETIVGEATSTSAESVKGDAEQPSVEAVNKPGSDDPARPQADTATPDSRVDAAAPSEGTNVAELGDVQAATGDAVVDVGPGTDADQPAPASEAQMACDGAVPPADSTATEGPNDAKATLNIESVRVLAEQPAIEAANELGSRGTAPAEADVKLATSIDSGEVSDHGKTPAPSAGMAELIEVDPVTATPDLPAQTEMTSLGGAAGDALIDDSPETEAERPPPAAELSGELGKAMSAVDPGVELEQPVLLAATLVEGDVPMLAPDPYALGESSISDVIPTATEEAGVEADQPVVEGAKELDSGDTAPAEIGDTIPAVSMDPAGSLETVKAAELDEVQPAAGDALVDVDLDREAELEQPVPSPEALVEGDAYILTADPGAVVETSTGDVMPSSTEAAGVDADQPVAEAAKELGSAHTTPAISIDPAASLERNKAVELDEVQPTAGGALVDADVEPDADAEPEQPAPPAEAPVKCDAPVSVVDPDAAGEAITADSMLTFAEEAGVDAEQPVVAAANDSDSGTKAPVEVETLPPVVRAGPAESSESTKATELGEVQSAAADPLVDACREPEAEPELPVPTAKTLTEDDAVPAGNADARIEFGNGTEATPTPAESAGLNVDQPAIGPANTLGGDNATPADVETPRVETKTDMGGPLKNATLADFDDVQSVAGGALVGSCPETDPAQPVPAAETHVDEVVPPAEPNTVGEASAADAVSTFAGSGLVSTELPTDQSTNRLRSEDTAPNEAGTTGSASIVDLATSLDSGKNVELGEASNPSVVVHELFGVGAAAMIPGKSLANAVVPDIANSPTEQVAGETASNIPLDAHPQTLEQPAPTAEAQVEGGVAVLTADPDAVKEGKHAAEPVPTSAEPGGADFEKPLVEPANKLTIDETAPAQVHAPTPAVSVDQAAPIEKTTVWDLDDVPRVVGDNTLSEAGPDTEAEPEQSAPTAKALAEGGTSIPPAADSGATAEESTVDATPTSAESVTISAEQQAAVAANEPGSGEAASAEEVTQPVVATSGSTESLQVTAPGDIQPAAGSVPIGARPETTAEQSSMATEGDGVMPAVDHDVAEETNAGEAMPASAGSVSADDEQPTIGSTHQPSVDHTTPAAVADVATPGVSIDAAETLESSGDANLGGIQSVAGDVPIDAGPATTAEQTGPATEGDGVVPAADFGAAEETNAGEAIPSSAGSVSADDEQPTIGSTHQPSVDDTTPAVMADAATPGVSIDAAETLESSGDADLGCVQSVCGDVPIDAGPATTAEQPALVTEGNGVVPVAGSGVTEETNAKEAIPSSVGSVKVDAEQPAVGPANGPSSGDTIPEEVDTATPDIVDPASSLESIKVLDLGDDQFARGDVLVGAGPEATAEQPPLALQALAEGEEAVPTADSGAAEGVTVGEGIPMAIEAAGVELAVEVANEPGDDKTAPAEADTTTPVLSVDPAKSSKVADLDVVESKAGDRLIDAGPEFKAEHPSPATEALMDSDAVVPAADFAAVGDAGIDGMMPTPFESEGVDAEQPAVEPPNELGVVDQSPLPADATPSVINTVTPESMESSRVADSRGVQPDAGNMSIEIGPETAGEQPVPAVEGDEVILMADPRAGEEAIKALPMSAESVKVDAEAEQPAVEAATEPGGGGTTAAEDDTTTLAVGNDVTELLASSGVAELGDVQPDPGDVQSDAGPEKTTDQPAPAAEGDEVVPAVDPGIVGEANAGETLPSSAQSLKRDTEQLAVEVANEPGSDQKAHEEIETTTVNINPALSLDSTRVAALVDVQAAAIDSAVYATTEAAAEQPFPASEAVAGGDGVVPTIVGLEQTQPPSVGVDELVEFEPAAAISDDPVPVATMTDTTSSPMDQIDGDVVGIATIDAAPHTVEQPAPAAEAQVLGDVVEPTVDPDVAKENVYSDEAVPTAAELVNTDAEQLAVEVAKERGSGDTAPPEADITTSAILFDPAAPLKSSTIADLGGIQRAAGDALVQAGSATTTEQPALTTEGDGVGPAAGSGAAEETNAGDAIPSFAGSVSADDEQPTIGPAHQPSADDTTPAAVADAATPGVSIDAAETLESSGVGEHGGIQSVAGDVPIDAGPATTANQPAPATEGDGVVPAAGSGAAEETNASEAIPSSVGSVSADTQQPAVGPAHQPSVDDTTPAVVADVATPGVSIDAAETLEGPGVADPGDIHQGAANVPIDAGPATTANQPAPATEGDEVMPAAGSGAAEETNASEAIPSSVGSVSADAEQPAVGPAHQPRVDDTTPAVVADVATPGVSIDAAETLEGPGVADPGDIHQGAANVPIDAGPATTADQPAPATEGDEVVPAADSGAAEETSAGEAILSSVGSVDADAEQPAVGPANEPSVVGTAPAVADVATPGVSIDAAETLRGSAVVDIGDAQSVAVAGDAHIDAGGTETTVEQHGLDTEGNEVMPTADPGAAEDTSAGEPNPASAESAELPAVVADDDQAPAEADTVTVAGVDSDLTGSLKDVHVSESGVV
eukprot:g10726.t2